MQLKSIQAKDAPKRAFFAFSVLASAIISSCGETRSQAELEVGPPKSVEATLPLAKPAPPQAEPDNDKGCKESMARIGGYCIDRYEAYVVEFKDGKEVVHPHSVQLGGAKVIAKNAKGVFPQSSINRSKAEEACRNAGKRLCTLNEWKKACMGVQDNVYPYGNEEIPGACNTGKSNLIVYFFGSDTKKWTIENMNDPYLNIMEGYLAKSGAYPACVSSYGVYDMVGGLHEWVSTPVDSAIIKNHPYRGHSKNRVFTPKAGNGIFMGGFYSTRNENGQGCNYMTIVHGPDQYDYSIGFRCCMDAAGN